MQLPTSRFQHNTMSDSSVLPVNSCVCVSVCVQQAHPQVSKAVLDPANVHFNNRYLLPDRCVLYSGQFSDG